MDYGFDDDAAVDAAADDDGDLLLTQYVADEDDTDRNLKCLDDSTVGGIHRILPLGYGLIRHQWQLVLMSSQE